MLLRGILQIISPVYEELAKKVELLPENGWYGLFRQVRTALVTACYMLRAARAGACINQ